VTVLIVDDESAMSRIVERFVTRWGYSVKAASSVAQAVEILSHDSVHLCVTDYQLSGETGLDLLRFIRGTDRLKALPVVVLSGSLDDDIRESLMDFDVATILDKPLDPLALEATLQKLLKPAD